MFANGAYLIKKISDHLYDLEMKDQGQKFFCLNCLTACNTNSFLIFDGGFSYLVQ